jgi:hypothetical protein
VVALDPTLLHPTVYQKIGNYYTNEKLKKYVYCKPPFYLAVDDDLVELLGGGEHIQTTVVSCPSPPKSASVTLPQMMAHSQQTLRTIVPSVEFPAVIGEGQGQVGHRKQHPTMTCNALVVGRRINGNINNILFSIWKIAKFVK